MGLTCLITKVRNYQGAFAVRAVYLTTTDTKKLNALHIMGAKVAELIHESNEVSWPIADHITGVQVLILAHTIHFSAGVYSYPFDRPALHANKGWSKARHGSSLKDFAALF